MDARTARKLLDENRLQCIATHRSWQQLREQTDKEIEFHQTLGCDFAAIGGIPGEYPGTYEGYRRFVEDTRPVIEKLKAAGIRFGHHNHSHEFYRPERHGKTLEDILIEEGGKDLMLELDLYWIEHAGLNCARILEHCPGRVPVIHLKDKEVVQDKSGIRMAAIGEGNMDWEGIVPACKSAGVVWFAVEQDECFRDPFDCLKSSFDYLNPVVARHYGTAV